MYNSLPPLFLFSASSPTSSSLLPPSPPHLSAQAFHDAFGDFIAWLRDTELKIQRDDPLKLEVEELKTGLAYLQVRPAEYGRVSLIPRPLLHKVIKYGSNVLILMRIPPCACFVLCSLVSHDWDGTVGWLVGWSIGSHFPHKPHWCGAHSQLQYEYDSQEP